MSGELQFIDLKSQYAALKERIDTRIQRVLDHGQYIMGPEVGELETQLAAFTGARHCITVASGTEALLISLMALDLRPGDEVITTPFTFAATVESIVRLGCVPVFVDIEPDTCNLDAAQIEAALSARTKAIMPVSLYGQVADMDAINAIAGRHGLAVIEDAAQSFGASYRGRKSGNLSTLGCTSFFPSKPLGCYGDGGAIFTNDAALAQACREIRVHGQSARYSHTRVGVGGRMDTLQCAIVLAKLERFDWEVTRRQALGARYAELLAELLAEPQAERPPPRSDASPTGLPAGLPRASAGGEAIGGEAIHGSAIALLGRRADRDCVWAQYTLFVARRAEVQAALQARGVPTAVHYPRPLHRQPAYAFVHRAGADLSHSEAAAERVLSLPMSADLTEAQQQQVVAALRASLQAAVHAAAHPAHPAVRHRPNDAGRPTPPEACGEASGAPGAGPRGTAPDETPAQAGQPATRSRRD